MLGAVTRSTGTLYAALRKSARRRSTALFATASVAAPSATSCFFDSLIPHPPDSRPVADIIVALLPRIARLGAPRCVGTSYTARPIVTGQPWNFAETADKCRAESYTYIRLSNPVTERCMQVPYHCQFTARRGRGTAAANECRT